MDSLMTNSIHARPTPSLGSRELRNARAGLPRFTMMRVRGRGVRRTRGGPGKVRDRGRDPRATDPKSTAPFPEGVFANYGTSSSPKEAKGFPAIRREAFVA